MESLFTTTVVKTPKSAQWKSEYRTWKHNLFIKVTAVFNLFVSCSSLIHCELSTENQRLEKTYD